jgi:hypothetical protein
MAAGVLIAESTPLVFALRVCKRVPWANGVPVLARQHHRARHLPRCLPTRQQSHRSVAPGRRCRASYGDTVDTHCHNGSKRPIVHQCVQGRIRRARTERW